MANKFKTLEHNGVLFPDEYIPQGYKLQGVELPALAEEMLYFFASKIEDEAIMNDIVYLTNFETDMKRELPANLKRLEFPADFMTLLKSMKANIEVRKVEKAAERKANKEKLEEEKKARDAIYQWAMLDGEKIKLGAYKIEPPGIYPGRGNSPIRGHWKYRVRPEDITINWVSNKPEPQAPAGHSWGKVEKNTNAFQIAFYKVDVGHIFECPKKVQFAADSKVKIGADQKKFEKAKNLAKNWDKMEKHIAKGLKSKDEKTRQAALVSWLIANTAIRVGTEIKDKQFDSGIVGASTLLVKNVKLGEVNE